MESNGYNWTYYWKLGLNTVKELETDQGILASGKNELYGAIFGRDSLITALKLLRVYQQTHITDFLTTVRKVLLTLVELQGKEVNPESGEQPGKSIHEYRPEDHDHLTKDYDASVFKQAWYVYPDFKMRNYDTVDATSLLLVALYRYYQVSGDEAFLKQVLPAVHSALNWIFEYGDSNQDGFIDYKIPENRTFGGLINHNWMDSFDSTFHEDGTPITYPVAPVEAQAYTYLALRVWSRYFAAKNEPVYRQLQDRADKLKKNFNEKFIVRENGQEHVAYAVDDTGKQLTSSRSNVGHVLYAALNPTDDGVLDGILATDAVAATVEKLMGPDMFEPDAGIRTLSSFSKYFNSNSYHNGSIWPHDTSMIAEGLDNYGYHDEAKQVRRAMLKAVAHFKTPIELYVYDQTYADYLDHRGRTACKTQAWTAASLLNSVAGEYKSEELEESFDRKKKPYNLVGFTLPHALQISVLADKLQLKNRAKIGEKNFEAILKTVLQICSLNVVEKVRNQKVVGRAKSMLNTKALVTDAERAKLKKVYTLIKENISR